MNKHVIAALISLSPLSMIKIANQAEIDPGNLSAWLKDKRVMSEEAQQRLVAVLGIENDVLVTDKVFCWQTDRDFSDLQLVLDSVFHNAQIISLAKARQRHYTLDDLLAQPMAALINDAGIRAVVVLKTPFLKELKSFSNPPWLSPEFLMGTSWSDGKSSVSDIVQLPAEVFKRWKSGNVAVDEFNDILLQRSKVSWQTLIELAERKGISTEQIFDWLSDQ
jgi:transcriptional regulator with XRE-family HTH domain